jgi:hypothetical protein
MIMYATLGAHDLKAAVPFYDKLMPTIGSVRVSDGDWGVF